MSKKERAMLGQVMIGIPGTALDETSREMLRHPAVGGVILFTRNFESVGQLKALCAEIHALREPRLLIAVDQEGGRVQRFRGEFTVLPAPATLGERYREQPARALKLAELNGWLMAAELRAVGVDISFAPVLDLGQGISQVIGDRAFHDEPEAIAAIAQAYVKGMARAGMAATGKHFPGHGSVREDSHLELPRDPRSWEQLSADLLPFQRLIESGIGGMMMAHVIYESVDTLPGSFSRVWVTDILRGRYGFDGAVFSDDLGMQAADCIGDYAARAQAALEAGCDMVLLCNELDELDAVLSVASAQPAAARRIAAMLGRPGPDWATLRASPAWREAVELVTGGAGFDSGAFL